MFTTSSLGINREVRVGTMSGTDLTSGSLFAGSMGGRPGSESPYDDGAYLYQYANSGSEYFIATAISNTAVTGRTSYKTSVNANSYLSGNDNLAYPNSGDYFSIGYQPGGGFERTHGYIKQVLIYNKQLTESELQDVYNNWINSPNYS